MTDTAPSNSQSAAPQTSPGYVASSPHSKEHAPIEHIRPSDPGEAQVEIHQELKEHGVEARQDETKLELAREQQNVGMQHAPAAHTVTRELSREERPEFPLSQTQAIEEKKKGSVWNSVRWLAEEVLKQMKIKEQDKDGKRK